MRKLWRNYNLSIVLLLLFLGSWLVQGFTGWKRFASEESDHGEVARFFGDGGYMWSWLENTFENWQSEFLQLFTFVVLTAFLIHRGSHESKDGDDAMMSKLDKIEQRLDRLEH